MINGCSQQNIELFFIFIIDNLNFWEKLKKHIQQSISHYTSWQECTMITINFWWVKILLRVEMMLWNVMKNSKFGSYSCSLKWACPIEVIYFGISNKIIYKNHCILQNCHKPPRIVVKSWTLTWSTYYPDTLLRIINFWSKNDVESLLFMSHHDIEFILKRCHVFRWEKATSLQFPVAKEHFNGSARNRIK